MAFVGETGPGWVGLRGGLLMGLLCSTSGCPSVTTSGDVIEAGHHGSAGRAGELGDGSLAGELLAAARRLVGLRLLPEVDAGLEAERAAFEAHLAAVAAWRGGLAPGKGEPGELWRGEDGGLAVIEASLGGGRLRVIGPARGDDGVRVRRREVRSGRVLRPVEGTREARVGLAGGGLPR
jgi:hypothetical protein